MRRAREAYIPRKSDIRLDRLYVGLSVLLGWSDSSPFYRSSGDCLGQPACLWVFRKKIKNHQRQNRILLWG